MRFYIVAIEIAESSQKIRIVWKSQVHHLFSPSIPAGQRLLTNHSLTQMQVGIDPY